MKCCVSHARQIFIAEIIIMKNVQSLDTYPEILKSQLICNNNTALYLLYVIMRLKKYA